MDVLLHGTVSAVPSALAGTEDHTAADQGTDQRLFPFE